MPTISPADLQHAHEEFDKRERRQPMYTVATFLVKHFWDSKDRPKKVAEGLGVLLLVWNSAFYRRGPFDFDELERCIEKNSAVLNAFRKRDIVSYANEDDTVIRQLFDSLLKALSICDGKLKGRESPVSVAKALHLLAPAFFPLGDMKIAKKYRCYYNHNPADKYLDFMGQTKQIAAGLSSKKNLGPAELLKRIDEFNYAKFTKNWL